jgi:hypothetical protein
MGSLRGGRGVHHLAKRMQKISTDINVTELLRQGVHEDELL